jgi:hypothetical protein
VRCRTYNRLVEERRAASAAPNLAQMKRSNTVSDAGSIPATSTNKINGGAKVSTVLASDVDGQGWRGTLRHANASANKTAKVIAFPASASMAFAAAA